MNNPYWQNSFFEFFITLVTRLFEGFRGALFSDEVQLFVLIAIAISSALCGTFLIWRRMSMLANSLSHTILAGIVMAYLVYSWLYQPSARLDFSRLLPSDSFLLGAGILMALLTTFLTQSACLLFGISEDASTGIVFTLLFAVGILLVTSLTKSAHVGVELLMGNVDALSYDDLLLGVTICFANIFIVLILWRALFLTSFDPIFAQVSGISVGFYSYLLMILVAITAVAAFRAVGVLLFLALLVTPPLIARRLTDNFKKVLLYSCLVGATASLLGVAFSRHLLSVYSLAVSTGALVVSLLFVLYMLTLLVDAVCKKRVQASPKKAFSKQDESGIAI
jgi:manganese/zinc/iron transport system permease protein